MHSLLNYVGTEAVLFERHGCALSTVNTAQRDTIFLRRAMMFVCNLR